MMQLRRALALGAALVLGGMSVARAQESLKAIWGSGPADIWAAGSARVALHFDGRAWSEVPFGVPVSGDVSTLWGSGPHDVFAAGESGMILHWNGQAWSRMSVPTDREVVALAGRSATEVYALVQSYSDREAPTLLRWDGQAWTPTALPMPFRANGLALAGADVLVAGFVMHDPTPSQRRTYGVLARRTAARWVMTGWNGQAVTDQLVAGSGWGRVGAVGTTVFLTGEREGGERVIALSTGGAFTVLPPAVSAMSGRRVSAAFLAADGVPVALLNEGGLTRYSGGVWVAAGPGSAPAPGPMTPQMARQMQEMQQAAMRGQVTPQMAQQAQQMAQAMQNPMALGVQMAAWSELGNTQAAWGPSSRDFYVVTDNGRIIRVQDTGAQIVYDASCSDPSVAGFNPICQVIQQQQQANPPPPQARPPQPSAAPRPKRP